ncbi:MAG: glycosyltransferase [Anaerolineae bacterium]
MANKIFVGIYMLNGFTNDDGYKFEVLQPQEFETEVAGNVQVSNEFIDSLAKSGYRFPDGHLHSFLKSAAFSKDNVPVGIRKPWPEDLQALGKVKLQPYPVRTEDMQGETLRADIVQDESLKAARLLQYCADAEKKTFKVELKIVSCDPPPELKGFPLTPVKSTFLKKPIFSWSKQDAKQVTKLVQWASEKLAEVCQESGSDNSAPLQIKDKIAGLVGWWIEFHVSMEKSQDEPQTLRVPIGILLGIQQAPDKRKVIGALTEVVIKDDFDPLKNGAHIEGYHYFVPSHSPTLKSCIHQRYWLNKFFDDERSQAQSGAKEKAIQSSFAEIGKDSIKQTLDATPEYQAGALLFIPGRFEAAYFEHFHIIVRNKSEADRRIPKIIHRFWAGRPMPLKAYDNLIAMQNAVDGSNNQWKQILWTSAEVNKTVIDKNAKHAGLEDQLNDLRNKHVIVCDVAVLCDSVPKSSNLGFESALKIRITAACEDFRAVSPTYQGVKYLSDFARLAATYLQGGVYMDVDISPRETLNLKLSELYHRDLKEDVPLAGLFAPEISQYKKLLSEVTTLTGLIATAAKYGSPVGNYFYATRPNTVSNREALQLMIKDPKETGMGAANKHYEDAQYPEEWIVPWIGDLNWATEASQSAEQKSD